MAMGHGGGGRWGTAIRYTAHPTIEHRHIEIAMCLVAGIGINIGIGIGVKALLWDLTTTTSLAWPCKQSGQIFILPVP
jgi:hypothetical protein